MRVLIVGVRTNNRERPALQLLRHLPGVELIEVSDEATFRQALEEGAAGLVLIDSSLGWTDELQIVQQVRARWPHVPALMLVDPGNEEGALEGMRAGLSGCLAQEALDSLPAVVPAGLEQAELRRNSLRRQHQAAVRALRQADERCHAIAQLTTDMAYVFRAKRDDRMVLEWASGDVERLTGYTPEQVERLGGWRALVHEFDRPLFDQYYAQLLAGQAGEVELRIYTRDRQVRYLRFFGQPLRDKAQGRVTRICGCIQDVTALHRTETQLEAQTTQCLDELAAAKEALQQQAREQQVQEEELAIQIEELRQQADELQAQATALQEAELRFRTVADYTWDWEFWLDPERRLRYVSPSCRRISGYTAEELIQSPRLLWQMVYPGDATAFEQEIQQALAGKSESGFDYRLVRKDGQITWVSLSYQSIADATGGNQGVRGSLRDVDKRKRVENELQESKESYQRLLETANEGILMTDAAGVVTYANAKAAELLGYTVQELVGRPEISLVDPAYASTVRDRLERRRIGAGGPYELKFRHKEGRGVWLLVSASPIRSRAGQNVGSLDMYMDLTTRKQAEQERERLLEEQKQLIEQVRQDAEIKATLLREVNHRVKNNLAAVIGLLYTQMNQPGATDQPAFPTTLRELTHRIESLSIVHGLLSHSQWAPLRLDDLVERIMGAALQSLPADRVTLEVLPSPVLVSPDQAQTLALVLNELALNVVKHVAHQEGLRVVVKAIQENRQIVLTVRDNGRGYPDQVIAERQVGMGLELLRNLVRQNLRGQIVLRNEPGAVAEIRFPQPDMTGEKMNHGEQVL